MELIHPWTNIVQSKWQLPDRSNIVDIRLTSWDKIFTVQGGVKRPSNVEITCHQNLSFPIFFPINVRKKGRTFYLFQKILGNLNDRTRAQVIRTPSMHLVGGQVCADWAGFIDFFAKQKQLEHFDTHFVVRTLKSAFMPNFSQIGEVKWPRFFWKSYKLLFLKVIP